MLNGRVNWLGYLELKKSVMSVENKHHYFISGSVGVGKSSAINHFMVKYGKEKIKTCYIKEYIDYDCLGAYELDLCIKGKTSLLQFQFYILGKFIEQLDTEDYKNAKFVIWERHPMEALKVFSQGLKEEEKEKLRVAIEEMCETFGVPCIDDYIPTHGLKLSTYHLSSDSIADLIYDEMKSNLLRDHYKATFIFLYVPKPFITEQQERIFKRGRQMEIQRYSKKEELEKINDLYIQFANTYLSGGWITDIEI